MYGHLFKFSHNGICKFEKKCNLLIDYKCSFTSGESLTWTLNYQVYLDQHVKIHKMPIVRAADPLLYRGWFWMILAQHDFPPSWYITILRVFNENSLARCNYFIYKNSANEIYYIIVLRSAVLFKPCGIWIMSIECYMRRKVFFFFDNLCCLHNKN